VGEASFGLSPGLRGEELYTAKVRGSFYPLHSLFFTLLWVLALENNQSGKYK